MTAALRFAIVGTGFAGTCTLWHLVHRLTDPENPNNPDDSNNTDDRDVDVTIVTVEQRPVNGPGYPYAAGEVDLAHRCNNQASTMAIHGNDFVEWMSANARWLVDHYPKMIRETHPTVDLDTWQPDGDEFYPRALFGLYLEQRFRETIDRAREHGITVESYVRHEAVDGRSTSDGFAVTLRSLDTGETVEVDRLDQVLLGTGHWQPTPPAELAGHLGYVVSPYPPAVARARARLVARPRSARRPVRVFVQGMGPSGIDAILTLCGEGYEYTSEGRVACWRPPTDRDVPQVITGSRSGFFPPIRGSGRSDQLRYLTAEALAAIRREHDGYLRLDPILDLLDADLRHATDGQVGWTEVTTPPFDSARDKLVDDLYGEVGDIVHSVVLRARRLRFYRDLTPEDKIRYDRSVDTHVIRTAVPIPAANGEKLLALLDAGILSTVGLGYERRDTVQPCGDRFRISHLDPAGARAELQVDYVVRAVTQDFAMHRHPSPLIANLLRRGEIVPHSEGGHLTGGISLHTGGYRVQRSDGATPGPSPHLAAFGAPVRFWQNEHNFAAAFVAAAQTVADDWAAIARTAATRTAAAPHSAAPPAVVPHRLIGSTTER
ncbi:FAD/NAD(P)-binding protein [Pseudonocardia sp. ICBG1293]|uniref:FAD/NAD(P)-binding protein n=1 Tax=Pseudonocardia sp. ICBG1293 TaxID=2844382 RepID=UPI001CCAC32A|nr:FAD/NAD(P)-binding protein [Pseudonocardia sp. ICBG1293]